jgi:hypothetical protein
LPYTEGKESLDDWRNRGEDIANICRWAPGVFTHWYSHGTWQQAKKAKSHRRLCRFHASAAVESEIHICKYLSQNSDPYSANWVQILQHVVENHAVFHAYGFLRASRPAGEWHDACVACRFIGRSSLFLRVREKSNFFLLTESTSLHQLRLSKRMHRTRDCFCPITGNKSRLCSKSLSGTISRRLKAPDRNTPHASIMSEPC